MKKALALFVALSLCLTSVPLSVFAGETGQCENVTATVSEDDPAADAEDGSGIGADADTSAKDADEAESVAAEAAAEDVSGTKSNSKSGEGADAGSVKVSAAAESDQPADLSKYLTDVTIDDPQGNGDKLTTEGIEVSLDDPSYSVKFTIDFLLPTQELYTGES